MRLIKDSKCEECGALLMIQKDEILCSKCFLVHDDAPVNLGPERMINEDGETSNKPSAPITYRNPFFGSIIDISDLKKRKH